MSSGALNGIRYRRGKTVLDSGSRGFGFAFNMRLLKFISMFEEIRMHRLPALLLIVAAAVPADAGARSVRPTAATAATDPILLRRRIGSPDIALRPRIRRPAREGINALDDALLGWPAPHHRRGSGA